VTATFVVQSTEIVSGCWVAIVTSACPPLGPSATATGCWPSPADRAPPTGPRLRTRPRHLRGDDPLGGDQHH